MPEKVKDGFTCECGEYHKYPAYVYAHYDEKLKFLCPKCGREYSVRGGIATQIRGKKKVKNEDR